jgi:hypothetical protein
MTANATWRAWSCTVRVTVDRDHAIEAASADLEALMHRVELACSRFRDDSEISQANARAGLPTPLSALATELVSTALTAAADSDGAVDPTVGQHLVAAGYDTDIDQVRRGPGKCLRAGRLPQTAQSLRPSARAATVGSRGADSSSSTRIGRLPWWGLAFSSCTSDFSRCSTADPGWDFAPS